MMPHSQSPGGSLPASDFGTGLPLSCWALSFALHAVAALSLLHTNPGKPPPKREQLLVVEVVGLVSTRQVEQKQKGDDSERIAQKPATPPPQAAMKKTEKKAVSPMRKAPAPVKVKEQPKKKNEPKPEPERQAEPRPEQQTASAAPPASEQTTPKGVDAQQVQQALKPQESEATLIRKYLAGLKREIQNHLEYPREARDAGYVGSPVIRFTITESGDILPGSLSVHKSSGSALLDAKALQAARDAAPMAKPPRQMAVTITVVFTLDG